MFRKWLCTSLVCLGFGLVIHLSCSTLRCLSALSSLPTRGSGVLFLREVILAALLGSEVLIVLIALFERIVLKFFLDQLFQVQIH
ncbi:MAG: hypothetical protein CLLPBCKN_006722 [Chroococcidiopsis cubana SAG 39.79]|nr:hypothetical protein [Chroococcidiopsis cubana SAG 39.79]